MPDEAIQHDTKPPDAPRGWRRWADGGWIDRQSLGRDHDRFVALREGRGVHLARAHLITGLLYCFMLGWPMSFIEIGGVPLVVVALVRLLVNPRATWGVLRFAFVQPLAILLFVYFLWQLATVPFAGVTRIALEQTGSLRFFFYALFLFPLLHRRTLLIGAILAGFLCGNLAQLSTAIGVRAEIPALIVQPLRDPARNGGWWPSVYGGELLAAVVALYLPLLFAGRGKARVIGVAFAGVAMVGLFATGTRSGWLAAFATIALAAAVFVWRIKESRKRWLTIGACLAAITLGGAAVALTVGPSVAKRAEVGWQEVQRAMHEGDFHSDNGVRLKMKMWAWEFFQSSPIIGHGAGAFPALVREKMATLDPADAENDKKAIQNFLGHDHGHAHDAILTLACNAGVVGLLLAGLVVFLALRGSLRDGGVGWLGEAEWGGLAAGPFFAIIAMLCLWPFEAFYANAHTSSLWWVLLALCPAARPRDTHEKLWPSLVKG